MLHSRLRDARRAASDREAGFTLIELLVVVIIIGILAAIAIPIYLGVQNNSKDAGVKSDLTNEKTAITSFGVDLAGTLPTAITGSGLATVTVGSVTTTVDLTKNGWSKSGNTSSLTYQTTGSGAAMLWCIDGVSVTGKAFRISTDTESAVGTCTALGTANY